MIGKPPKLIVASIKLISVLTRCFTHPLPGGKFEMCNEAISVD